jgi:hypothetical protein
LNNYITFSNVLFTWLLVLGSHVNFYLQNVNGSLYKVQEYEYSVGSLELAKDSSSILISTKNILEKKDGHAAWANMLYGLIASGSFIQK